MKKLLNTLTGFTILATSLLSCSTHVHKFSKKWTFDSEYHWHEAICEHEDLISDKAPHYFDDQIIEPTPKAQGYTAHTCIVCQYRYIDSYTEYENIPADAAYGIKFSNGKRVAATPTDDFEGFKQYYISSYSFKENESFQLYNFKNDATWVSDINPSSFNGNTAQYINNDGVKYSALKDFTSSIYIKLKYQQDQVYFGL